MAEKPITVRRVAQGLLLLAAGIAVTVGVADSADVYPPTVTVLPFDSQHPAVQDGMTVTDGVVRFRAEVFDVSEIVSPPVLTLDGSVVAADVGHATPGDEGDGESDWTRWWVVYSGVVADGPHVLALDASDSFGNAATATYGLNVVTRPTITGFEPVSYGADLRPVVSAKVGDANTAIDPRSITLTLDGTIVAHGYDAASGVVTYVPPADLTDESYHTAVLGIADAGGLSASFAWVFYVSTYPDMADSSIGNCTTCHPADVEQPGGSSGVPMLPWEAVHVGTVRFGGELHTVGGSDCWVCHGGGSGAEITTAGYVICGQCHGRPGDWLGYGYGWYHGQHTGIEYTPAAPDPALPVRIARNREMVDCIVCHQPGVTTQRTTGIAASSHDIPELHKSTVSVPSVSDCAACHARSLTREHARDGRLDRDGQAITCDTCHRSSDPAVLGAIAEKNTHCLVCHARAEYVAAHHACDERDCRACHGCFFDGR